MSNVQMAETLERRLGVFSATTLIVGSMIGSGIFIAPSIMAGLIGTPGIYLGLWLIGGALTRNRPLAACGRLATLCAAEVISHLGARPETSLKVLAADAGLI